MRQLVRRQRAQQQRLVAQLKAGAQVGLPLRAFVAGALEDMVGETSGQYELAIAHAHRPIVLDHRRALDGDRRRSLVVDPRPGRGEADELVGDRLRQRQPDPLPVEDPVRTKFREKLRDKTVQLVVATTAENARGLIRVRNRERHDEHRHAKPHRDMDQRPCARGDTVFGDDHEVDAALFEKPPIGDEQIRRAKCVAEKAQSRCATTTGFRPAPACASCSRPGRRRRCTRRRRARSLRESAASPVRSHARGKAVTAAPGFSAALRAGSAPDTDPAFQRDPRGVVIAPVLRPDRGRRVARTARGRSARASGGRIGRRGSPSAAPRAVAPFAGGRNRRRPRSRPPGLS